MALTVLLGTDGSDLAKAALAEGLAVLGRPDRVVIATAIEPLDPTLVVGAAGMAGGVMSPAAADHYYEQCRSAAEAQLAATRDALGLATAEMTILSGAPGPALCDLAASLPASVIVIGTRGHGGLRRAVLGSVSDHVVRNAPCPVVTAGPDAER